MTEIDLDALPTPEHGYTVDDDDDDPVLLDRDGNHIDTWRERYPYDHRMSRDEYERLKRRLQIELLKLQKHYFQRYISHLPSSGEMVLFVWFSVSPAEQRTRFAIRLVDPVRQWKFSPMDMASVQKWKEYTAAKERMWWVNPPH
ncbi:hypothetical protein B8W69_12545 [Mycobacterium vulneris]|jgi:polyphosphate kinase 2 (PPK2 family)|uniref:Polyphosphate kinase-2-related domain-containing protein n=1 Tax=Mycolicibacterium vulneris TaxID=547163 RepID=A0A1X2L288_9MYCO|nr:hypothetical protein B8W69_12545 [Mycolicibacterium vulneris]